VWTLQALAAIDGGAMMQLKMFDGGLNLQAKKLGVPALAARQVATLNPETIYVYSRSLIYVYTAAWTSRRRSSGFPRSLLARLEPEMHPP